MKVCISNKLDGFMLKRLAGKHANIVADQDAQTKVPDGVFKQLVGGRDWMTADVKYKEAINFKNTARLIFAVNKLPYSQAKDAGYYTRIVTLVFNNKFVVNPDPDDKRQIKANPEMIDEIIEKELDGILIWALEGLDRLLANKKLTIPQSSIEALDEYQKENSSVLLFVDETCKLGSTYSIDRTELYTKYKEWCEDNGFNKKVNARTFYKTLEFELGIEYKKSGNTRKLEGIRHLVFV
jgi:putative DNA primase/helicase